MSDGKRVLPTVATVAAGLGLLAFIYLLRVKSQEIELLRAENEHLKRRAEGRAAPSPASATSESRDPAPAENKDREELLALRKELAALKAEPGKAPAPPEDPSVTGSLNSLIDKMPAGNRDPASLKAKAMNESLPSRDRVTAFGLLRHLHPEARTPEVTIPMLRLLASDPDERNRADLCRHFRGMSTEDVKRVLLGRAAEDASPKVREQAVDTLGRMPADPLVRNTLERLRTSETDAEVQRQLRKALEPERK